LRKVSGIDGNAPLFVSVYSESDDDLALEGALARDALDNVTTYFGKAPFSNYTVVLEFLKPVSSHHAYNFSMEHLNSGTFYMDVDHALTANSSTSKKKPIASTTPTTSRIPGFRNTLTARIFPLQLGNDPGHRYHLV